MTAGRRPSPSARLAPTVPAPPSATVTTDSSGARATARTREGLAGDGLGRGNLPALALALAFLVGGLLVVPAPPLSPVAGRTLGVLGFAVVLWATGTLSATLVAVIMMVLWPLLGVLSFAEAVRGFGGTTVWLLIGIMLVAAAFNATGFDQRIALRLLDAAHGRARPTILWTVITLLVLTFLIPTGAGRAGVMLPIAQGMVRAARLERGSNVGRAIFLASALVSLQSGAALMTGSIATLYAAGVFEEMAGHRWTYLSWLALALPSVFLISLLACPVLLRLFPPEVDVLEGGREYLRAQMDGLGPMRPRELKVALLFGAMVLGWMTAQLHGLATEQVCLLAMLLMFLPPWPALSFEEGLKRVSWSTVVLFGSSLSLAVALERSQVMDVLVQGVGDMVPRGWPPIVIGLLGMLTVAGLRLGFPNTIALVATLLPAAMVAAASLDINPVWLGMLAVHASQILILPVQSPTSMTLYSAGYFSMPQMLRSGLIMAAVLVAVTVLSAQLYWPLLGVGPR